MKTHKYRIYPNAQQKMLMEKHFECARRVYSWALSEKEKHYKETGKSLSKRAIQDVGWGMFLSALEYKCQWNGKNLIRIGRFVPSAKTFNGCGHRVTSVPLSVRVFECPECSHTAGRDHNAVQNIRDIGLADSLGLSDCVKCSPVEIPVSAGSTTKGASEGLYGSQEAPTGAGLPAWGASH